MFLFFIQMLWWKKWIKVSWKYLSFPQIVQMNNYFGLGIDAELSLDFHLAREDEPDKFTSR